MFIDIKEINNILIEKAKRVDQSYNKKSIRTEKKQPK